MNTEASSQNAARRTHGRFGAYLFCAVAMCYGWGWRGVYGHEAGAMVPGALVAMAVCLASGRQDWHRRSVVAGLCGAVGWAWGGTLTNMEHRLYILSDAPADVYYGFACIGLVGLLWSGMGGAVLALAFTRPRSELNRFIGPLVTMSSAFLITYIIFVLQPELRDTYEQVSEEHWHDGEWLSALTTLAVMIPYWLLRKQDRPATRLFLECAAAWWIGYLGLTKFGGIELAPPYRSESWGGAVGILVALIAHHIRNRDRAAVLFTLYAMLAGCIGFILALQIHVPFIIGWGPCAPLAPWKIAEESFGFFMGFGVAMGAGRLMQGGLAAPDEDAPRDRLDVFGVFVLVVVIMWMNLRRNVVDWRHRYKVLTGDAFAYFKEPFPQFEAWQYFLFAGLLWSALVVYGLVRYRRRRLALVPASPFEKGALVLVVILAVSLTGVLALRVPDYNNRNAVMSATTYLVLSAVLIWMLLARSDEGLRAVIPDQARTSPTDACWKPGWKHWALWLWVPLHILIAGTIALAMTDEPWSKERHRFGPNATWRLEQPRQADERPGS